MRAALPLLILLAFAPLAEAQTPARDAPAAASAKTPRAPARQTRNPAADPSLVPPSLQRVARPSYEIGGGSSCRTACSQRYYFCVAEGEYGCSGQWSQCLAACPQKSSPP